jgi:hypothetical protein
MSIAPVGDELIIAARLTPLDVKAVHSGWRLESTCPPIRAGWCRKFPAPFGRSRRIAT